MSFFNFSKKKPEKTCSCGGNCKTADVSNARFIVLGACCKKSLETFENTKKALLELGIKDTVVNLGDNLEIAKYGVVSLPALVINNKVVSYGKFLKVEDVINLIIKEGITND